MKATQYLILISFLAALQECKEKEIAQANTTAPGNTTLTHIETTNVHILYL